MPKRITVNLEYHRCFGSTIIKKRALKLFHIVIF